MWLVFALVGFVPAWAFASSLGVLSQQRLSGRSPYAACSTTVGVTNYTVEPSVASNPRNPSHLIAAWQQDVNPEAARGIMSSWSADGGRHWHRVPVPRVSRCSGGGEPSVTDVWVSFSADGTAYLTTIAADTSCPKFGGVMQVSRSRDEGRHWSPPTILARGIPSAEIDKDMVAGDPVRPGRAYVTWDNSETCVGPTGGSLFFSRTINSGRSWSPPRALYHSPSGYLVVSNETLVLPDRTLVVLFSQDPIAHITILPTALRTGDWNLFVTRSRDGGVTWSHPTLIRELPITAAIDPATGRDIFAPTEFFSSTPDPRGNVFLTWSEVSSSQGRIRYIRGSDDGTNWSQPRTLATLPGPAFSPTIASLPDGTLGVTWYGLRRHQLARSTPADWWFARSTNHGRSWQRLHLAGPFDLAAAHEKGSSTVQRLGEYFGLAATVGGFDAVYVTSHHGTHPVDVFSARLLQRRK